MARFPNECAQQFCFPGTRVDIISHSHHAPPVHSYKFDLITLRDVFIWNVHAITGSETSFGAALSGNPVISVNGQLDVQQHKKREDRD